MNKNINMGLQKPWEQVWPLSGLEMVSQCPVCGGGEREELHTALVDNVFRVAPGKWTLWKCAKCSSAYLDPRPTIESINLAYVNYYTHSSVVEKNDYASLSTFRKWRRSLVNGYTNWRFSTREVPASHWGVPVLLALWTQRRRLESEYRHLPRLPASGGRLLDIGCGNGTFLKIARLCGWDAMGIEPDQKAANSGQSQGLNIIQGGIEQFDGMKNMFNVITLSHVIEHVHDPVALLNACFRLLKPGGRVWLETPNINSLGHRRYGKNWRGLETPRHLVLFNSESMVFTLERTGFKKIEHKKRPNPLRFMTKESEAMRRGQSIDQDIHLSLMQRWNIITGLLQQTLFPSYNEVLTIVAFKPDV